MTKLSSLTVFALLAACDGGDLSPRGAAERSITLTCSKAHTCRDSFPPNQGFEFTDIYQNTEGECTTFFKAQLGEEALLASVDAGRILYDGADAAVCLDFFSKLTCAQFWDPQHTARPTECDTAFIGTVADGSTCTIQDDCAVEQSSCNDTTKLCGP